MSDRGGDNPKEWISTWQATVRDQTISNVQTRIRLANGIPTFRDTLDQMSLVAHAIEQMSTEQVEFRWQRCDSRSGTGYTIIIGVPLTDPSERAAVQRAMGLGYALPETAVVVVKAFYYVLFSDDGGVSKGQEWRSPKGYLFFSPGNHARGECPAGTVEVKPQFEMSIRTLSKFINIWNTYEESGHTFDIDRSFKQCEMEVGKMHGRKRLLDEASSSSGGGGGGGGGPSQAAPRLPEEASSSSGGGGGRASQAAPRLPEDATIGEGDGAASQVVTVEGRSSLRRERKKVERWEETVSEPEVRRPRKKIKSEKGGRARLSAGMERMYKFGQLCWERYSKGKKQMTARDFTRAVKEIVVITPTGGGEEDDSGDCIDRNGEEDYQNQEEAQVLAYYRQWKSQNDDKGAQDFISLIDPLQVSSSNEASQEPRSSACRPM